MKDQDMAWGRFLQDALKKIEARNLLRTLRVLDAPPAHHTRRDRKLILNFSSNDYLGLANHPALKEAARQELERGGVGAGSSRLVCGTLAAHEQLEATISAFKRTESSLTFSSGYAAAIGTIPAICGKDDIILLDKRCHACLVDAARLSGARLRIFPHNDLNKLEHQLSWARRTHPARRILVLVESVYSMDGDLAPLRDIVALKDRFGAWLFLDEAHGVGVLGKNGRGLAEGENVAERVEIQMGTLGKALGTHGAYIAGNQLLRDFLINRARSFIYSTAPPAPIAAAARKAFEILESPEGELLLASLRENIHNLCSAVGISPSASAIVPWIIGDEVAALSQSAQLLKAGFLVPAIRPPTVAKGTARLRITLSAEHTRSQIQSFVDSLLAPLVSSTLENL